jgi:hypothetical protein
MEEQAESGLRVRYVGSTRATFVPETDEEREMLDRVADVYAAGKERCAEMPLAPYTVEIVDGRHITLPVDKDELIPLSAFLTDPGAYSVCDVRSTMALLLVQALHGAFTGLVMPTSDVLFYKPRSAPVVCHAYNRTFSPAYLCCILPLHGYHPVFDPAAGSRDSNSFARGFVRVLAPYVPIMAAPRNKRVHPMWVLVDALIRSGTPSEVDWPQQTPLEHLVNLAVDVLGPTLALPPATSGVLEEGRDGSGQ